MIERYRHAAVIVFIHALLILAIFAQPSTASAEETQDERIARINREIEESGGTWRAGRTWPGSLPAEERRKLLGLIPLLDESAAAPLRTLEVSADLPTSFDWRGRNGVTPVKNQGSCGSCWAFAAVAELESYAKIYDKRLLDLSEQAVINCTSDENTCDGGYVVDANNLFMNFGAVSEYCVPYTESDGGACTQASCEVLARISGFSGISTSIDQIKQAIYDYGPITTHMYVHDSFYDYTDGCYNPNYTDPPNHAVLLIGWDDNACVGEGAWIIKNSWGEGWGMEGFGYVKYGVCSIGGGSMYVIDYIQSTVLVDLHSPNGGEELEVGGQFDIEWSISRETPDSISIMASLNSGATYDSTIAAGLADTARSYTWTVPNWPVRTMKVKVIAWYGGGTGGFDISDSDFRIIGKPYAYVSPAGADIYPYSLPQWAAHSIQDAVDASFDGDTVMVAASTYSQKVSIDKPVQLLGGWNAAFSSRDPSVNVTTLQSAGSIVAFMNVSGHCGIDGFRLTGGTGRSALLPSNGIYGGGIFAYNSSPVISGNVITGCGYISGTQFSGGGAIACYNGTPAIAGNTISGCVAQCGGSVYLYLCSADIRDNTISGSSPSPAYMGDRNGGGVYALHSEVSMSGNVIENCSGYVKGAGVYSKFGSLSLEGDTISSNSCSSGGGGVCTERSALSMARAALSRNSAGSMGGGIFHKWAPMEIENSILALNTASLIGGGIYADSSWGEIGQSTFDRNGATYGGSGIMLGVMQPVTIRNNLFTHGAGYGVQTGSPSNIVMRYNNSFGNSPGDFNIIVPDSTNISSDPHYADTSSFDYHLGPHSGAIDAGDPSGPPDPDGSRADQGAFGGPEAAFASPTFIGDLAANAIDGDTYRLTWTGLTPGQADQYFIYASPLPDFVPCDTVLFFTVPASQTAFDHDDSIHDCMYYRLAAVNDLGYCGGWSNLAGDCTAGDLIDPVVQVVHPSGDQRFYVGNTMPIQWIATDNDGVDSVCIWLSVNAGRDYALLFGSEPNDSLCEWEIPQMDADSCVIKVVAWDAALNSGEDTSEGIFSVKDQTSVGEDDEEEDETPSWVTGLEQNYPNPFNGTTSIAYTLAGAAEVDLRIYDTAGRLIKTLETGAAHETGRHVKIWNGTDDAGRSVSSGVYFARIRAGKFTQTRKMVYLR